MAEENVVGSPESAKPESEEQATPHLGPEWERMFVANMARMHRQEWEHHREALHNQGQAWLDRRGPEYAEWHQISMIWEAALALEYQGYISGDHLLIYAADLIRKRCPEVHFQKPITELDTIAEADAYCVLAEEGFFGKRLYHVQQASSILGLTRDVFQKRRIKQRSTLVIERWRQSLDPYGQEKRLALADKWLEEIGRRHRQIERYGK